MGTGQEWPKLGGGRVQSKCSHMFCMSRVFGDGTGSVVDPSYIMHKREISSLARIGYSDWVGASTERKRCIIADIFFWHNQLMLYTIHFSCQTVLRTVRTGFHRELIRTASCYSHESYTVNSKQIQRTAKINGRGAPIESYK